MRNMFEVSHDNTSKLICVSSDDLDQIAASIVISLR